ARALADGTPRRRVLQLALAGAAGGLGALVVGERGLGPDPAAAGCPHQTISCYAPGDPAPVHVGDLPGAQPTCWYTCCCCGECSFEDFTGMCNATFPACNNSCCWWGANFGACTTCELPAPRPLPAACQALLTQLQS